MVCHFAKGDGILIRAVGFCQFSLMAGQHVVQLNVIDTTLLHLSDRVANGSRVAVAEKLRDLFAGKAG